MDRTEDGSSDLEILNSLRAKLVAAAKAGDIQEVGRINRALAAIRESLGMTDVGPVEGHLNLSVEERSAAGTLVFEALRAKIPASNLSIVVSPETNRAGSPVVTVTLPSLRSDQSK